MREFTPRFGPEDAQGAAGPQEDQRLPPLLRHTGNRALQACARFKGDLLIVESEHDHLVPHPTITSFISAFTQAHSSSYRVIKGGDHPLRDDAPRKTYHDLLVGWIGEMVRSARRAGSSPSPQN